MVLGVQGYTWAWCSLTEFWVIPRCSDCGLGDGWNGCTLLLTAPWWITIDLEKPTVFSHRKKSESQKGHVISKAGDSSRDLLIPTRWRSPTTFEGVTFSPSQKGHENAELPGTHWFSGQRPNRAEITLNGGLGSGRSPPKKCLKHSGGYTPEDQHGT